MKYAMEIYHIMLRSTQYPDAITYSQLVRGHLSVHLNHADGNQGAVL